MAEKSEKKESSAGDLAGDFYQSWRERVRQWAGDRQVLSGLVGAGLAVPDLVHLLVKLMADSRVPASEKLKMGFAVAYVASPIDLLPEFIFGPAGLLDDIAVVAWALRGLLREEHWDVIEEHWAGEVAALDVLRKAIDVLDGQVGSGRWKRLRSVVSTVEDALPSEDQLRETGKQALRALPRPGGKPRGKKDD